MAAGSGAAAITELALGEPWPRALDYAWPAVLIIWSLLVLLSFRRDEISQETIIFQRKVIEAQRVAIGFQERKMAGMRRWN